MAMTLQAYAKVTITLAAVSSGTAIATAVAMFFTNLPVLGTIAVAQAIVLLGLGAYMWQGSNSALMGIVAIQVVWLIVAIGGMARLLGDPGASATWYQPTLGATAVIAVGTLAFALMALRESSSTATRA